MAAAIFQAHQDSRIESLRFEYEPSAKLLLVWIGDTAANMDCDALEVAYLTAAEARAQIRLGRIEAAGH